MSDKRAVFFCSASNTIDSKYNQAARQIVDAACLRGYDIVSGGTIRGTMGHICEEASIRGARVRGVVPRFMEGLEHPALTECVWTDTMSERKEAMREGTCLAIALPGGIGTLDELAETYCLAKMGLYSGHIIVFNMDGFYDDFIAQLQKYEQLNMLSRKDREFISFPTTIEELEQLI